MSKVVSRIVCHGYRKVMGSNFPVESWVEKEPGHRYFVVVVQNCNGVPDLTKRFATKKAALAELDFLAGVGIDR